VKDKDIKSGHQISLEHIRKNKGVRKLLLGRGIKPELQNFVKKIT